MHFYATNPPIHQVCVIIAIVIVMSSCHGCCHHGFVVLITLSWCHHLCLASLWCCLHHCGVVLSLLSLLSSLSLCRGCLHRCVMGVIIVMSWLLSLLLLLSCHVMAVVITVSSLQLLSLHHCGCCCGVIVSLQCCCVVVVVLLCLCMALDIIDVIPGPPWASPLPTLFILAIHLVDGLGPCTCPCHCVVIIALSPCRVVSCCHHIVTTSCHVVAVSLSSLHCHRVVLYCHRVVLYRRCVFVVLLLLLLHCHHVVVVVALSPCCVVLLLHCCHVALLLLLHCCVVALLQLLHGEHRAAGPRAGTGRSYSIAWDAAAIVGER